MYTVGGGPHKKNAGVDRFSKLKHHVFVFTGWRPPGLLSFLQNGRVHIWRTCTSFDVRRVQVSGRWAMLEQQVGRARSITDTNSSLCSSSSVLCMFDQLTHIILSPFSTPRFMDWTSTQFAVRCRLFWCQCWITTTCLPKITRPLSLL